MKTFIFLHNETNAIDCEALLIDAKQKINLNEDYIIAVDGGYSILSRAGIVPNAVVGDFDSLTMDENDITINKISYPKEKDFSDFEGAITNIPKTTSSVVIYGFFGGRFDHSLANLWVCSQLSLPATLINFPQLTNGNHENCWYIPSGYQLTLNLVDFSATTISTFPLTPNGAQASTKGLKYNLQSDTLDYGSSRGLSNEITDHSASISCEQGGLLVIYPNHSNNNKSVAAINYQFSPI